MSTTFNDDKVADMNLAEWGHFIGRTLKSILGSLQMEKLQVLVKSTG
mgnify:CR=1 FL=1